MLEISLNVGLGEIRRKKGKCSICRAKLHADFPEDFPNEWKFCCSCYDYAKAIACWGLRRIVKLFLEGTFGIDKHTFIRRAKKIDKLINVV